jgi:hypothetical protein
MSTDPENIRQVIAKQPTPAQGVAALLRAVSTAIHQSVDKPDPEGLLRFAKHIDNDPRAWIDAVFANTPQAMQTYPLELSTLPEDVRDAFAVHGSHAAEGAPRQQAHTKK